MTRNNSPLLGLGALAFGLIAVLLRNSVLETAADYGIYLPFLHSTGSTALVFDATRNVTYIGSQSSSGVEHFQSIFHAQDTSGKNRFAPPAPIQPELGSVIDATAPGAWCPQGTGDVLPFTSRVTNISENCLSLRIARVKGTRPGGKLPVVVWLHGGGHALGSGYEVLYEPDGLVKQAAADGQPLVFVAINYHLGFFGFATGEAMVKAKQTNAGLRDQRVALEWIRDNIESFGGDPRRVTAIGQSVGASDISLQMTAFGGEQGVPFQQAITMSGGPGLNFNTKSDLVANNTAAIAQKVGCLKEGEAQSEATLECLREAPVEVLTNLSVTASRAARPPFGEGFFFPTYDDDFLPGRPSELVRAGRVARNIPTVAAWVSNDGAWYASPTTSTDDEVLGSFGLWLPGLSQSTKSKLLELYPPSDFEHMAAAFPGISPQYYRAAQMNRDLWFACPVVDFAWQYARHNAGNVRVYEHNATRFGPSYEMMGVPMWGVAHLSDIPYVLNVQTLGGGADNSAAQLDLSREISRSIVQIVNSGAPKDESSWPMAFKDLKEEDFHAEFPTQLSLRLFGWRHASHGYVTVSKHGDNDATEATRAVSWEKLFERRFQLLQFSGELPIRDESGCLSMCGEKPELVNKSVDRVAAFPKCKLDTGFFCKRYKGGMEMGRARTRGETKRLELPDGGMWEKTIVYKAP
ncbi:lipase [Mycena polygramma]|nr:lipase [Mycena polygramma]